MNCLWKETASRNWFIVCISWGDLHSPSVCVLLLEPVGAHLGVWIWSLKSMPRTILLPLVALLFCWHRFTTSFSHSNLAQHSDQLRDAVRKIYSYFRVITCGLNSVLFLGLVQSFAESCLWIHLDLDFHPFPSKADFLTHPDLWILVIEQKGKTFSFPQHRGIKWT